MNFLKIGGTVGPAAGYPKPSPGMRAQAPARDMIQFSGKQAAKPMTWDPKQYLSFENHRLRPALDLIGRIPMDNPAVIVDLGCGTGNATRVLKDRWPGGKVTGLDNSKEMLGKVRKQHPDITWRQADIAHWKPRGKVDVIFSNAALHWLPNHEALFPRLMQALRPGGVLAVQMPRNFAAPSHTLMHEAAQAGPWKDILAPVLRPTPVLAPQDYYRILSPHASRVDIWETEYLQVLEGENPVADWTKGTWLKPLLDVLPEPLKSGFEADYRRRIKAAYPADRNGKTLFPFRRLFIIARK